MYNILNYHNFLRLKTKNVLHYEFLLKNLGYRVTLTIAQLSEIFHSWKTIKLLFKITVTDATLKFNPIGAICEALSSSNYWPFFGKTLKS